VGDGIEKREAPGVAAPERAAYPASGPRAGLESSALELVPVLEALSEPVLLGRGDRILTFNRAFGAVLDWGDSGPAATDSLSGALGARAADERGRQDLLLWLAEAKSAAAVTSQPVLLTQSSQGPSLVRFVCKRAALGEGEVEVITAERMRQERSGSKPPEDVISAADRLASVTKLASGATQAVNNPLLCVATNVTYSSERLEYVSDLLDDSSPMQVSDPRTLRGLLLPVLEALSEAHVGATRAGRLIRDLRCLVELDTAPTAIDVRPALEAAVNLAEGEVALRAHLRTRLEADGFVLTSTTRLTQLLLGLIVACSQGLETGNPQKYRIDVRSWTEGDWALISVADNVASASSAGANTPHSRRADGLDLCERLAVHLGGTLEVQNSTERGSSWTLRLPLTSSARKERSASLSPVRPGRRTRVLVVDNEPLILRALSRLLRADYDVETAGGGYEALDLIRHDGPFDLVLCDLGMPEMSGIELYAEATRAAPEIGPRFVFVTGGTIDESVQSQLDALTNQVLEKPIQPELLRDVVSQLLGTTQRPTVD